MYGCLFEYIIFIMVACQASSPIENFPSYSSRVVIPDFMCHSCATVVADEIGNTHFRPRLRFLGVM